LPDKALRLLKHLVWSILRIKASKEEAQQQVQNAGYIVKKIETYIAGQANT
jgi:hypothetical protein